jgi:phage shock protein E
MCRFAFVVVLALIPSVWAQTVPVPQNPLIDYAGFAALTDEVAAYRQGRLLTLEGFQRMAAEPGTVILDARSREAFAAGHIEGAVNLPFTDFTSAKLGAVLGDPGTRVLIYCNNNFIDNVEPVPTKAVQLALNIQTFVNLYGYGWRNVYELGEAVSLTDPRIGWARN